jgi:translation initiation factor 1
MAKKSKKIPLNDDNKGFANNPFAALATREDLPAPQPEAPVVAPKNGLDLSKTRVHTNIEKKGRGGKTVTVVFGLDALSETHINELMTALKKGLGVGVTLEEGGIIVQGDQRPRLPQILAKFGHKDTK